MNAPPNTQSFISTKFAKIAVRQMAAFVDEGVFSHAEFAEFRRQLQSLVKTGAAAPPIEPKLLTQAEVAALLGLSLSNFKHQEALGNIKIPRKVIGGAVRYRNLDVYSFMAVDEHLLPSATA